MKKLTPGGPCFEMVIIGGQSSAGLEKMFKLYNRTFIDLNGLHQPMILDHIKGK